MTSLDGPGFSITLLRATREMLEYIDAPTKATGWSVPSFSASIWQEEVSRTFQGPNVTENEDVIAKGGMKRELPSLQSLSPSWY